MAKKHNDPGDRGAIVLHPEPPGRGSFVVLVPTNMTWDVDEFGGALRLTFRPRTPAETAAMLRGKPRQR